MSQGSRAQGWRAGVPSLDSLTLRPEELEAILTRSPDSWQGEPGIAASHPDTPTTSGSGIHHSGTLSGTPSFYQSTIPDHILDNPEEINDAPYMPPRVTQAELDNSAHDPRRSNVVYGQPNPVLPSYPYECGTSPAESHNSVDSNWSASSSSSTSSQRLPSEYLAGSSFQYLRNPPLPASVPHSQHYPAYHGQHRLGLDHIRYGDQQSNTGGTYYRTPPHGYSLPNDDAGPQIDSDISSQMSYAVMSSSHGSPSPSAIPTTNQPAHVSTFSVSPVLPTDSPRSRFPDAGPYLRQQLGLAPHEAVSLQSLPDPPTGEKPSAPLPMLIKLAIYGSPGKQLTLQEIYSELENRFQWFRDHKHDKAWKNSIRHNLSLNKVFQHVPRPITEPGKGSYWQLDVSGGEGYKRTRKRRPKNKLIASEEEEEEASEMDEDHPNPSDSAGLSRPSSEDPNIDPGLRSEGHVVGEARMRSMARRAGGGSPYPSQSPRYQQGPLPVVAGQDANAPAQPLVCFGQPSFGHTSFPTQPQTMPVATTNAPFPALLSSTTSAPPVSTLARPHVQSMVPYDRSVQISHPQLPPRAGIEYVMEPGGLPAARRVRPHPDGQAPAQVNTARSSPEASSSSSSSGSSQTWNETRSGPEMRG